MSMTNQCNGQVAPALRWKILKPYLSAIVLECTAEDPEVSFGVLQRILMSPGRQRAEKKTRVVAFDELSVRSRDAIEGVDTLESLGIDQLAGLVRQVSMRPGWTDDDSEFIDTTHNLNVVVRRNRFIAVRVEGGLLDKLQRWLDKPPLPPLRRIAPKILESTFLMGEAKGLWLRGVHRRSTLRPDTKTTSGLRLQDTIDSIDDSSFVLGSARCHMPDNPDLAMLKGTIGSTLRNSQAWFKAMPDLRSYIRATAEILQLIEEVSNSGESNDEAFPLLAREVADLSEVFGAYEITPLDPEQMPSVARGDDAQAAAGLLQEAALNVQAGSSSARFILDVGLGGVMGGSLAVKPKKTTHGYTLDIGFAGEPSSLELVQPVFDALNTADLLTVYYQSGHVYSGGRIWKQNTMIAAFPRWSFADFAGYCIDHEKPHGLTAPQEIHDATGSLDDTSLFSWVVKNYSDGWLICDDGSDETADFLQISSEGTLRVIHVKASGSSSSGRQVSASAYEVVVSQASKNLIYMDKNRLAERLRVPTVAQPACWKDGERVADRAEFIEIMSARLSTDATEIVVVQPHVSEMVYKRVREEESDGTPSQNLLRLRLLETLLNSARASIVKAGADLTVIGSRI
jgi:hypothetical protein